MDRENLIFEEQNYILQTYKRLPIVIDYAFGAKIFDVNGNSYLDFLGGIAVNVLGHSHPKVIEAIEKQIRQYMHISNYFYQEPQVELAKKLTEISGFKNVFFSNSGTEATEGALKIVRRWGNMNNKRKVIAFSGGFHGRTYGALSIMDKPHYKCEMEPFLDDIKILQFNNIDDLEKNIDENTAGIFLELIQGEGGLTTVSEEFVIKIKELREKFNFLIVADEIQSGVGRTGNFLASDYFKLNPDIVNLAKGLGGGLPLGCILVNEKLSSIFESGMHGTTFGGNAVACAAGITVLEELENGLFKHINEVSGYLLSKLKTLKDEIECITEIRGKGLMLGVVLNFDAGQIVEKLLEKGVITNAASGNVLRLVPPYIITEHDVDEFISALKEAVNELN